MIAYLKSISFAYPSAFTLVIIPLIMVVYLLWKGNKRYPELTLSTLNGVKGSANGGRSWLLRSLPLFRILSLIALIAALARPQLLLKEEQVNADAVDIVIAMDISGSMLARDFQPDRLNASIAKAEEFISGRETDRIGLVVFAGESFTQCPITTDHNVLKSLLGEIKQGLLEDGTAIGMGLLNAVNRLKDSEAKSKIVILLTDGDNNAGDIDPISATDAALEYDIKVYTIGVGSRGTAPFPFKTIDGRTRLQNIPVNINEELLQTVAKRSGGKYFRATDNESLKNIYAEIDKLEKTEIQVATIQRVSEEFLPFALLAGAFLLLEIFIRYTLTRSIP